MRLTTTTLAALLIVTLAMGCSDGNDPIKLDGAQPTDGMTPVPDGYGPLWPCNEPGKACNAHDPCAINPVCGVDKLCRPASLQICNDGLDCTADTCLGMGQCKFEPKAGSCALPVRAAAATDGGVGPTEIRCFYKDDKKPDDPCQLCDPDNDNKKWTGANGGLCDDNNSCTRDDYCQAGLCKGTYYGGQCADAYGCTEDLCDGKGGCLGNKLKSDWCLIGGVCYKDGMNDLAGTCNTCDVTKSQSAWTPITNSCQIDSKCYKPGDKHPLQCAECDPAASKSSWTVKGDMCLIERAVQKARRQGRHRLRGLRPGQGQVRLDPPGQPLQDRRQVLPEGGQAPAKLRRVRPGGEDDGLDGQGQLLPDQQRLQEPERQGQHRLQPLRPDQGQVRLDRHRRALQDQRDLLQEGRQAPGALRRV